jgi:hypothetical protein
MLAGTLFGALGQHERVLALPEVNPGIALMALDRPEEAISRAQARVDEAFDHEHRVGDLLGTLSLAGRHDEILAIYTERWGSPDAVEGAFGSDRLTGEMVPIATALRARDRDNELAAVLAHWGERLEFMREHGYANSYNEARHAALSGNRTQALATLTRAIDLGYRNPLLSRDPAFAELADDPEFQAQVERMIDLINAEREQLGLEPLT